MKHPHKILILSSLVPVMVALAAGCSSKKSDVECDPGQCAAKNQCISDGTATKCRLPCAAHSDCPINYYCGLNAAQNFCMPTNLALTAAPGQFGTQCPPSGGLGNNPACDTADGFGCFGENKDDANAYCTLYNCTTDLDCAAGYWCATVNVGPNVKSNDRTFGKTETVCAKRAYCSPCNSDIDCPVLDGKQSRCIPDQQGTNFCATVCGNDSNCNFDAACTGRADDGTKLCQPRAGVCKGDGSLCSPCRSDADCPNGFCIRGAYSPEQFCSVKSKISCEPSGMASLVKGDCPTFTANPDAKIGCETATDDPSVPKDQCVGVITFADAADLGCYTKHL